MLMALLWSIALLGLTVAVGLLGWIGGGIGGGVDPFARSNIGAEGERSLPSAFCWSDYKIKKLNYLKKQSVL